MKRVLFLSVVISVFLALAQTPVAKAAVSSEQKDLYILACVVDAGRVWTTGKDGKIVHVRGQVNFSYLYDTETLELKGEVDEILNYDLNTVTGSGGISGSVSFLLYDYSPTDPFVGTFGGHFQNFALKIRVVGRGTGEVKGVRRRARLVGVDSPPLELLSLFHCPPQQVAGVLLAIGTIDDSR